jgi:hypothetical protein
MDIELAQRLQREWKGKQCDHPNVDKERVRGIESGDWRCTQCGKLYDSQGEWEAERAKRSRDA